MAVCHVIVSVTLNENDPDSVSSECGDRRTDCSYKRSPASLDTEHNPLQKISNYLNVTSVSVLRDGWCYT